MTGLTILSDSELEMNLETKLDDVKHQMLTNASNKKPEISSKKISDVNNDCMAEIFMYIPIHERPKIAQVCKRWNGVLYNNWYQVKTLKFSHWEYNTYQNIFERSKKTNRLNFLKSLLDNCGYYLTELDLVAYDNSNIVPFVNQSCPNVVKLRLRFKFIKDEELSNAFSCMSKLKILVMIFQVASGIPLTALDSLKGIADTLSELTLACWHKPLNLKYRVPESFPAIIAQLKKLRKVVMTGIIYSHTVWKYLDNHNSILFIDDYFPRTLCMTPTETPTELELLDYPVTDDILYTFANNMPRLRTLYVLSTHVTDVGIQTITKMKCLSLLYLQGYNEHITDSSIKLLRNLEELRLPYSKKITNASAIAVLENSPRIKLLSIVNTGVTPQFLKIASKIASKRGEYLILCVNFEGNIFSSRSLHLPYLSIHHHRENIELDEEYLRCLFRNDIDLIYYEYLDY